MDKRNSNRRQDERRGAPERRLERPWMADPSDRRSARDRRELERRQYSDRRLGSVDLRPGGLAMQAMDFFAARQKERRTCGPGNSLGPSFWVTVAALLMAWTSSAFSGPQASRT